MWQQYGCGRVATRAVLGLGVVIGLMAVSWAGEGKPRARDLGVPFPGRPGPNNAITDVAGVEVGHTTLIRGEGKLQPGTGPVRTGVTAILPRGHSYGPVFAAWHTLNGNGEMTGTTWVEESGFLEGPVMITNTHNVGLVHQSVIRWAIAHRFYDPIEAEVFWALPVVAETWDGVLNDINGFHVTEADVFHALDQAHAGRVEEGNVGGGTGMVCHSFKGGIGTSSRRVVIDEAVYTIGVLVQTNYGSRHSLMVAGVPVGEEIRDLMPKLPTPEGAGSIIVVIATDAPLLPHQLKRIAKRAAIGIGRVGGFGNNSSGDIFIAFSTANREAYRRQGPRSLTMLPNDQLSGLFEATAYATEESIVNALVAAETMTGINGNTVYALPHERLRELLRKYGRLVE